MSQIILMAETGSDIPADLAKKEGIELVPMHVSFGDTTKDDGSFPPSDVVSFYKETGILPKTSGSVPEDFTIAFDRIHAAYPNVQILYLAYSAVTTCSYQSAQIASEGRDYIKSLDTKLINHRTDHLLLLALHKANARNRCFRCIDDERHLHRFAQWQGEGVLCRHGQRQNQQQQAN